MAESFNPAGYEISRALITTMNGTTVDMKEFIIGLEISQSINSNYSGSMSVLENLNYLEGTPLRGEEKLDLEIELFDTGQKVELKLQVFSISRVSPNRMNTGTTYTLSFISRTSYDGGNRRVKSSYKNKSVKQIVQEVFEDYVSDLGKADYLDEQDKTRVLTFGTARHKILNDRDRSLYIQPTEGLIDIIMPSIMPDDAFRFLSKRAMNTDTPSHTFRWFETIYGYYFVTDEFLIKEAIEAEDKGNLKELFYAPNASNLPDDAGLSINRINNFSIGERGTNSAKSMLSGAYRVKTTELDLVNGKVYENSWKVEDAKFIDMSGKTVSVDRLPHSQQYINEKFTDENARDFLVFKDTQGPLDRPTSLRSDANNGEIAAMRTFYDQHLNSTSVGVSLSGRIDLSPGTILNLNIPVFAATDKVEDNNLSGKYMIKSSSHTFKDGKAGATLNLIKFGWS